MEQSESTCSVSSPLTAFVDLYCASNWSMPILLAFFLVEPTTFLFVPNRFQWKLSTTLTCVSKNALCTRLVHCTVKTGPHYKTVRLLQSMLRFPFNEHASRPHSVAYS